MSSIPLLAFKHYLRDHWSELSELKQIYHGRWPLQAKYLYPRFRYKFEKLKNTLRVIQVYRTSFNVGEGMLPTEHHEELKRAVLYIIEGHDWEVSEKCILRELLESKALFEGLYEQNNVKS